MHKSHELTCHSETAVLGVASVEIVGPDDKREMLVLPPGTPNRYSIGIGEVAVLDVGLTINPGSSTVFLKRSEIGDMICGQINAIAAGAQTLGFLNVKRH